VFNVLLQLLDDGRLTDGQGRSVDFGNTVIMMTSNIGSEVFQQGGGNEAQREYVMDKLRHHFRPEFLNRVDEVVIFEPLKKEQIRDIVDIQVARLGKRLGDKRIKLELTDDARDLLAELGYDPVYGARPIKRVIKRMVLDPLAMQILEGNISDDSVVYIDRDGNQLKFEENVANAA